MHEMDGAGGEQPASLDLSQSLGATARLGLIRPDVVTVFLLPTFIRIYGSEPFD